MSFTGISDAERLTYCPDSQCSVKLIYGGGVLPLAAAIGELLLSLLCLSKPELVKLYLVVDLSEARITD